MFTIKQVAHIECQDCISDKEDFLWIKGEKSIK